MNLRYPSALLAFAFVASTAPVGATCTSSLLSPSSYAANAKAGDVTTGDFNNDTFVDVVVVNRTDFRISILLGTAGGGLGNPTMIATEYSQDDILSADFNNDGKLDLVLAISDNTIPNFPYLKLLLGNGDGTFNAVPYTGQQLVYPYPSRLVLGDFDKDGLMDAATTSGTGFSSMKNIGGKLAQKAQYTTPTGLATGIAVGDFDGDGNLDIAISEIFAKKVYPFFGVGDGTFTAGTTTIDLPHEQHQPADVEAGDFNRDGKDDLAIVIRNPYGGSAPLKIALSNGIARTFAAPVDAGSLPSGYEALVRDLDADGKLDIAIADYATVMVFRGVGDGTFAAPPQSINSASAIGLAIDDFDRDGGPDIVASDFVNGEVQVFLNTCGQVTLNLNSSLNPAPQGTAVTITGTVVSPPTVAATGTLTLKLNTTTLNGGNLIGGNTVNATLNDLVPATYDVTAEYSGDSRFVPATKLLSQVITTPPFGPPPGLNAISFGGPVQLAWYATANTDHYEVWRNNGAGWTFVSNAPGATFSDVTAPSTAALLYKVRAIAPGGAASLFGPVDLALTYAFTDGTLQPGVTRVKSAHLTELRSAANAVRALASLGATGWAEPSPQLIRASHLTELRTAIQQARTALGLATATYTDPTLTAGTTAIKAIHFEQSRAAMR
jgi:hypothetical protein